MSFNGSINYYLSLCLHYNDDYAFIYYVYGLTLYINYCVFEE